MVDRYLVERNGSYHLLLYLNYRGDEFRQGAFLKELAAIDPTARATSVDLVSGQLAETVKRSFIRGFAIGGILVIFLLIVHFESLFGVCTSLFPVLAGVIVMLGAMAGFGHEAQLHEFDGPGYHSRHGERLRPADPQPVTG